MSPRKNLAARGRGEDRVDGSRGVAPPRTPAAERIDALLERFERYKREDRERIEQGFSGIVREWGEVGAEYAVWSRGECIGWAKTDAAASRLMAGLD